MESQKWIDTRSGEIVTQFNILDINFMERHDEYKGEFKPWYKDDLVLDEVNLVLNKLTQKERIKLKLTQKNIKSLLNKWDIEYIKTYITIIKNILNTR